MYPDLPRASGPRGPRGPPRTVDEAQVEELRRKHGRDVGDNDGEGDEEVTGACMGWALNTHVVEHSYSSCSIVDVCWCPSVVAHSNTTAVHHHWCCIAHQYGLRASEVLFNAACLVLLHPAHPGCTPGHPMHHLGAV